MATAPQIAANRRNAALSSGPSPAGTAASRLNAARHGLAGATAASLIAPDSDRAPRSRRARGPLAARARPGGPGGGAALRDHRGRVDPRRPVRRRVFRPLPRVRPPRRGPVGRRPPPRRRRDGLPASPGSRTRSPSRLEATVQGGELKLESWRGLGSGLALHGTWTEAQRSLASDLLGVRRELRDAETAVDPAGGDAFEARRSVVAAEVARLTALRDGPLAESDAAERSLAEAAVGAELTGPIRLLHRYGAAALRRGAQARRQLEAARRERGEPRAGISRPPAPGGPRPAAPPIPAPGARRSGSRSPPSQSPRRRRRWPPRFGRVAPAQPAPAAGPVRPRPPRHRLTARTNVRSPRRRAAGPSPRRPSRPQQRKSAAGPLNPSHVNENEFRNGARRLRSSGPSRPRGRPRVAGRLGSFGRELASFGRATVRAKERGGKAPGGSFSGRVAAERRAGDLRAPRRRDLEDSLHVAVGVAFADEPPGCGQAGRQWRRRTSPSGRRRACRTTRR